MNKKLLREAATTVWLICVIAGLAWVIDAGLNARSLNSYPVEALLALR